MNKTWYFFLDFLLAIVIISIASVDSKHIPTTNLNLNDDIDTNEWRWSAQNDTQYTKSNLQLDSYNDYFELEYTSGDGRPKAKNKFERKLLDAGIVDDVIPAFPEKCLKVTYKDGDLIPGLRLTPLEVSEQPNVTFESDSDESLYTIFFSCNSKYIPSSSESMPHGFLFDTGNETAKWLVINIPGNNMSAGQSVYNYTPPSRLHLKQGGQPKYDITQYDEKIYR